MNKTGYVEHEIKYRLILVKQQLAGSVKHWLISVNIFMRDGIKCPVYFKKHLVYQVYHP